MFKKVFYRIIAFALIFSMQCSFIINITEVEAVTVTSDITINGYQISSVIEGIRTVYTVEEKIDNLDVVSVGLIYGVENYTNNEDMVCNSTGDYVLEFPAVVGLQDACFTDSQTANSYIMTMLFNSKNIYEYQTSFKVRAFAVLSDGTYRYSEIVTYSIYSIADKLYTKGKMPSEEGHKYLYDNILFAVNPDYKKIEYGWSPIVSPTN